MSTPFYHLVKEFMVEDDPEAATYFNKYFNSMAKKKKNYWGQLKDSNFYEKFVPRLKSFLWRSGMMAVAGIADVAVASMSEANLDNSWTVVLGLFLGELSKYLNKHYK